MKRILPVLLVIIFFFDLVTVSAQSCFNVNAGKDTTIQCNQSCLNLKAKIPSIRTSENYQVVPIDYTPYAFTSPAGNELNTLYLDDIFSTTIDLPFTFCFYGSNYNHLTAGSNGVLTFDVAGNSGTQEAYVINPGDKIPSNVGTPNNANIFYAPRASIFLAYYDMDPSLTASPPKKKIEWRLEGTAPCRKFVLSYYQIDYWIGSTCNNQTPRLLCTMQAVLYEGTGLIDFFYANKPACTAYQGGLAIAGVQNWAQNEAVTLPGKNGTVWTARNEGYRFVPNGSTSLLNRVELYKNNVLISVGTVNDLGTGELEATFNNICQAEDSMSYVVKAFYKQCDNPAIETEGSDTMIVYKTFNPLSTDVTNAKCNGANGTIMVTAPLGSNVEYSIDNGTSWQTNPVFNKPAGTYTIIARLIGSTCNGTTTATITEPAALSAVSGALDATCAGNDGTISIVAAGGTPAYTYSIDNGLTYQSSNIFTVSAGNYNNIKIKDANGCIANSTATVILNDQMFLTLGNDTTICVGQSVTLAPQTNTGTDVFKWTPVTGLSAANIKNPVATPADTTHYILNASWGMCNRTDDIWIKILHKPVAFAGKDSSICYKTPAFLKGNATNLSGAVNYAWAPAANVTPANAANAIAKPDTTQLYTLTVTDNYGCNFTVTDDVLITMRPPVPAFAGNDTNAIYGIPHQLSGSGGKFYLWSPSTPLNNAFAQKPLATLYNDTYFTLTVTDDIGCTNTDDVLIKVYKGPTYYIPNAFSPNGDGMNDVFRPIPVGIAFTDYFNVYNRLGEMVFQSNQWLKGWDGTYKGKPAAAGTYVWLIKGMDKYGKVVEMKGTVILVR
ncbi:gliding motility-associated C-terminal domain-containing protein [Ferruginibacter sp. SUN106]|uniref:T9SS type B sorting domain-containing protein n=1 Tax=Ferruginibacter sp. SUN106 TaxID=2978348 RepID=UPI003D3627DB